MSLPADIVLCAAHTTHCRRRSTAFLAAHKQSNFSYRDSRFQDLDETAMMHMSLHVSACKWNCSQSSALLVLCCQLEDHRRRGSIRHSMAGIPEVPSTSAKEAGPLVLEKKVSYLDVRTKAEFEREYVMGSVNVPWFLDLTTRQVRHSCQLMLPSLTNLQALYFRVNSSTSLRALQSSPVIKQNLPITAVTAASTE